MHRSNEKPEVPRNQTSESAKPVITPRLLAFAALGAVVAALLTWAITGGSGSASTKLTHEQVSATSEAVSFATSETIRKATKQIADATHTTLAQTTSTAKAREMEAAASSTAANRLIQAHLTANAPATQTTVAREFETRLAQARATIQLLNSRATVLAGPDSGSMNHVQGGNVACSQPQATTGNFALEVKFQNPKPLLQPTPGTSWDYGVIFAHPNNDLQYRMILDSGGKWALNLHTDGYDISNSDTTPLIDRTEAGSNTLKLFVVDKSAQLFINDKFIDTLQLDMFEQGGGAGDGYDIAVCAGIQGQAGADGSSTLYSGYTLWSVP